MGGKRTCRKREMRESKKTGKEREFEPEGNDSYARGEKGGKGETGEK